MKENENKHTSKADTISIGYVHGSKHLDETRIRNAVERRRVEEYLVDEDLLPAQRRVLREYYDDFTSRGGVKATSITNAVLSVRQLGIAVQKPFEALQRADINRYVSKYYAEKGYSERTRATKNVHIKGFFKWLWDAKKKPYEGRFPSLVAHLSTVVKSRGVIHKEDLLSPAEVLRIVDAHEHIRDKTATMMLYEAGARVSEILSLRIRDVTLEDGWVEIRIRNSKNGSARSNTLVDAEPFVKQYLNHHPFRDDPDAPLFINLSKAYYGRQLLYRGYNTRLRTAAKRAGIKKRVHPHLLRHSRATELACVKGWNEPKLRRWHGWTATSSTPTIYVHLAETDLRDEILRERGLMKGRDEVADDDALRVLECSRCGRNNPAGSVTCNCGHVLNAEDVPRIKKVRDDAHNFMDSLSNTPFRKDLIHDGMTEAEYRERLVRNDPALRKEFERVAKEVLRNDLLRREAIAAHSEMRQSPVEEHHRDVVLRLRKKGMAKREISEVLGIGYGTVQKILT